MSRASSCAAVILVGTVTPAFAADFAFDPRIELAGIYNDNYRMSENPNSEVQVSGARLDALVNMRATTPTSLFQFTPRLRSTRFPGDEDEESDDIFLRMLARHATERTEADVRLDYSQVGIRGRYFPDGQVADDDVLGEPGRGTGIGRVALRDREDRLSILPSLEFTLSERQSMELFASYLDVTYDVQVPGDRIDYSEMLGGIGFARQLTTKSALTIRGAASQYEADGEQSRDAYALDAEWRSRVSEVSEYFVRAGIYRAESFAESPGAPSDWDTGFVGGAGVRWGFRVTDIWLELNQSLDPNSSGSLVSRQQFRAQLRRRLTEVMRINFGARYITDSGTDSDDQFRGADFWTATVSFDWRLARKWTLVAAYDYRWRDYEDALRDAQSNAVSLGIVYEPNRR